MRQEKSQEYPSWQLRIANIILGLVSKEKRLERVQKRCGRVQKQGKMHHFSCQSGIKPKSSLFFHSDSVSY